MRAELSFAREALVSAELAVDPLERYATAQLAALRTAAAVVGTCAKPTSLRRRRSAWHLLARCVPVAAEWAGYFEVGQERLTLWRGLPHPEVGTRQADDHLRDAQLFLHVAEDWLEQQALATVSAPDRHREGA